MKKIINLLFVVIAVVVMVNAAKLIYHTVMHIIYPVRYYEYIHKYSGENRLDEYLVMGVIKAESNYIFDAHSEVAHGLMQLTDETAEWVAGRLGAELGEGDIIEPETNIRLGCYYLRYLTDLYDGEIELALAAYNAGPGNVAKWLQNPEYSEDGKRLDEIPFKETREYVKKVLEYQKKYKNLYRYGNDLAERGAQPDAPAEITG